MQKYTKVQLCLTQYNCKNSKWSIDRLISYGNNNNSCSSGLRGSHDLTVCHLKGSEQITYDGYTVLRFTLTEHVQYKS